MQNNTTTKPLNQNKMKIEFEKMLTDKANLSFMFTPLIAFQITNGKKEFGIGWMFWYITFKSE
jgi:hypothetical protein